MHRLILVVALSLVAMCAQASNELAAVAKQVVSDHVPIQEWLSFVSEANSRFKTWSSSHDDSTDRGLFLNDKLIELTAPKDVQTLKRVICWLALYEFYQEPLPKVVAQLSEADKRLYLDDLAKIERDFTWEKALALFTRRAAEAKARK